MCCENKWWLERWKNTRFNYPSKRYLEDEICCRLKIRRFRIKLNILIVPFVLYASKWIMRTNGGSQENMLRLDVIVDKRCLDSACIDRLKKRSSQAKLSRDLRGGSDGMSRAVADNFILSAVDLPDLPLPPTDTRNIHVFRYRAASSHHPPRPRCRRQFLCVASSWSYKRISSSTVCWVARYRLHMYAQRDQQEKALLIDPSSARFSHEKLIIT